MVRRVGGWFCVLLACTLGVGAQTTAPTSPPASPGLLIPASEATPTQDVSVNGRLLPGARYLDRGGTLLFPAVDILQALHRAVRYDGEHHVLTVDGKDYPVVVDPALQPPSAAEVDQVLYIDWRFLHGLLPPLQIGLGSEGIVFSAVLPDRALRSPTPIDPELSLEGDAPHETYYANIKDRRHYYHKLGCRLLSKDESQRYEIQDPQAMNFLLKQTYGGKVVLFAPCPVCIGKPEPTRKPAHQGAPSTPSSPSNGPP